MSLLVPAPQAAATAVYDGMAGLHNDAMGQPHVAAFTDPVNKQEYPTYHLVRPLSSPHFPRLVHLLHASELIRMICFAAHRR